MNPPHRLRIQGEDSRLVECSKEPIRTPGYVQPHGVLFVVDPDDWRVLQVSDNVGDILGVSVEQIFDASLETLLGSSVTAACSRVLRGEVEAQHPIPVTRGGHPFDAVVHSAEGLALIELEPTQPRDHFSSHAAVCDALRRLAQVTTRDELWQFAARELHTLAGFDRTLVYRFHDDGHGEVVAEMLADESLERYLGLHFPASDIPSQARELYLAKTSRTIASTVNAPSRLVPHPEDPRALGDMDLSVSELRSVSPVHLQFMRNMGQASTLSLSLVVDSTLVGMITCASGSPRRLPFALRQSLETLVSQLSLHLGSLRRIDRLMAEREAFALRAQLLQQFSSGGDIVEALLAGPVSLFDVASASAVALRHDGDTTVAGEGVTRDVVSRFVDGLLFTEVEVPYASDSISTDLPELATLIPGVAGALVVPFGPQGDFLAWFRPELTESVAWLGDQTDANRPSPLSPRNSFSAWTQTVSGTAEPWGDAVADAVELGRELDDAFFRSVESRLARLALRDPLTGLPNRRLLMDRLEHAIANSTRGRGSAVLFLDLDTFKAVNDSHGHDVGDAALRFMAEKLREVSRGTDTVARLGGDEFVVLCEDTDSDGATLVAERLLEALREPLRVGEAEIPLATSIGVATVRLGDTAQEVLTRADAAMYRAKEAGKNRVSL